VRKFVSKKEDYRLTQNKLDLVGPFGSYVWRLESRYRPHTKTPLTTNQRYMRIVKNSESMQSNPNIFAGTYNAIYTIFIWFFKIKISTWLCIIIIIIIIWYPT
jgi:hypothetical protein